ncbi:PhoD-like phosphatase [Leptothermofonsia sp. ETS-13]|uniref:PhoD-like phosphatase n=1 Tax=Leptothermofonsia sp. ETS-13 TaxID=3035696 RepID=UPI003BA3C801
MGSQTGNEFLQELPLILAGPILRHTESESVTVWVALKQACRVELTIYETTASGSELGNPLFKGLRSTIALGKFLHVVAVTARSEVGQGLSSDRLYTYDLCFIDSTHHTEYTLERALASSRQVNVSLSYFAHQKPTFALPPQQIQHLRIVHGSCRKPHGNGFDALPILDCLIEETASQPQQRPHQVFLTGDQIYADDVADPLLWAASNLGDLLLGWHEKLPAGPRESSDSRYYTPRQLRPGERTEVATQQAGFTAGLRNKRAKVNSHLLNLGEYYASYLLAWSPVCWMVPFPKGREMTRDCKTSQRWDREARDMEQFIHTLWKVQRALANVPVYTIFDDHDVSDDWNLNQAWCLRVYGRPLGRRAVQNALLAYAMFQAWGNTPWQFEANQPGGKLLAAAQAWSDSQGTDTAAYEAIAQYLGMPPSNPHTGLPELIQDDSVLILDRHPETITWHYTLQSQCHEVIVLEVIVLDTRTWRGYPANGKAIAPPMLLCPTAFEQQLLEQLQETADAEIPITFIIAPTNVFELQVIDWIHHWQLRRNKAFSTDVGDAWNINYNALARFLTTLFEQRTQVVILSRDIHYSSVVRLSHINTPPQPKQNQFWFN